MIFSNVLTALNKFRDFEDTQVCLCIRGNSLGEVPAQMDVEELYVAVSAINTVGEDRIKYHIDRDCIEMRMPYNRYLAFMRAIQRLGYNLKPEDGEVDIVNVLVKN